MIMRLFAIIFIFLLASCKPQVGAIWHQDLLTGSPKGPLMFRKGWKDGCDTGKSASGNHMQKFYYKFTQQHDLVSNEEYYSGWKVGWTFCNRYVFRMLQRYEF